MQSKIERSKNLLRAVLKKHGLEDVGLVSDLLETVNQICRERVATGADTFGHPAIRAVRAVVNGQTIPPGLYPVLIEMLGASPDVSKLRACYVAWHARGKPREGWAWALEWYSQGIPLRATTSAGPPAATLKDLGLA